jgi:hypothetical protein
VYDGEALFPHANNVRCHEVQRPWRVNISSCYRINLFRLYVTDPVSPMNDWGLKGTANSVWGAQCGDLDRLEAMTAIRLHTGYYNYDMECCQLYIES